MKNKTITKLCCPFDKENLELKIFSGNEEEVWEGVLICHHCNRIYPIVHGVPIMLPDDLRVYKLELPLYQKWNLLETEYLSNGRIERKGSDSLLS